MDLGNKKTRAEQTPGAFPTASMEDLEQRLGPFVKPNETGHVDHTAVKDALVALCLYYRQARLEGVYQKTFGRCVRMGVNREAAIVIALYELVELGELTEIEADSLLEHVVEQLGKMSEA